LRSGSDGRMEEEGKEEASSKKRLDEHRLPFVIPKL
jgi:hypothetical protein